MIRTINRFKKIIIYVVTSVAIFGSDSYTYVYLLPFENIQNDSDIDWISVGLIDMIKQDLKDKYGVRLKNKNDLEIIMNDRSLMLKQPIGSRNILVLGKYVRQLDRINVTMQAVDVATWDELGKSQISEAYTKIPSLNKAVGNSVSELLKPFLPVQAKSKTSPYTAYSVPKNPILRDPVSVRSKKVVSELDQQIAELETSMDVLLGAKKRVKKNSSQKPQKDVPRFNSGEWTMDFDVNRKVEDKPENDLNTQLLSTVLDQLINNPYDVELQRPEFEYHKDDELYMTVRFPIIYKLKEKIIKEMLTTLPYTGLEQNGSLTIFYFDRNSFNFPDKHVDAIKHGKFRKIPIIRIFDQYRKTLIVVADTPESYWHTRSSDKVLYLPQHQFSPLIDFSIGGWSMQVAMENVEIEAVYEFILPVNQVESLKNVSLKFVNEDDLKSFLDPLL